MRDIIDEVRKRRDRADARLGEKLYNHERKANQRGTATTADIDKMLIPDVTSSGPQPTRQTASRAIQAPALNVGPKNKLLNDKINRSQAYGRRFKKGSAAEQMK